MTKRVKDILSKSTKAIDDGQLMRYLDERSVHEERHEIEKQMADDSFLNDAVEGLQQFQSGTKITSSVALLQQHLKNLAIKKARKKRHKLKEQPWIYIAIVVLLLLLY